MGLQSGTSQRCSLRQDLGWGSCSTLTGPTGTLFFPPVEIPGTETLVYLLLELPAFFNTAAHLSLQGIILNDMCIYICDLTERRVVGGRLTPLGFRPGSPMAFTEPCVPPSIMCPFGSCQDHAWGLSVSLIYYRAFLVLGTWVWQPDKSTSGAERNSMQSRWWNGKSQSEPSSWASMKKACDPHSLYQQSSMVCPRVRQSRDL